MNRNNKREAVGMEPIDLNQIGKSVLRKWYLFPIFIIIMIGLAFVYLQKATPKYKISSTVLIKEGEKNSGFSENAIYSELENLKTSIKVEDELEKLKSKSLLMDAILKNHANVFYYNSDGFFSKEIDPVNAPISVKVEQFNKGFKDANEELDIEILNDEEFVVILENGQQKNFKFDQKFRIGIGELIISKLENYTDFDEEVTNIKINILKPNVVAEHFSKALEFETTTAKSSSLYIGMLDSSPERGVSILTSLLEGYNEQKVNQKNEAALKTISFIDERLNVVKSDLDEVEMNAEQYKTANRITDLSLDSKVYLENTAVTRKELSELNSKIDILESIEMSIQSLTGNFDMIPSSLIGLDPVLSDLLSKFNDLQRERQRLSRTVQPTNPQIQSLNEQASNMRNNIIQNIRNVKSNLLATKNNLEGSMNENSYRAQRIPVVERELMEINRQKELKQEHYQFLLKKREESALALEITGVNSLQVIDAPIASLNPVSPNKMIVMAGGLGMGLFIPLMIIFLQYKLSTKVTSKNMVERYLSIPILGEIAKNEEKGVVAITPKSVSPPAEQLRLIRNNLRFLSGESNQVIMVTSSMSQEGKTFFSINLAATLSLVDKKVVILDLDLRRPSVFKSLEIKAKNSLNGYLKDQNSSLDDIIERSVINENLDIIGLNKSFENPADIINSYKISEIIEYLKTKYDHIIIDTSPIGLVADSYSLSKFVDVTVYMVRMNFTKIHQLKSLSEIIDKNIFKQNFIVINNSDKYFGSKFGYGYYSSKDEDQVISV